MNYPNDWPCKNCNKVKKAHYLNVPKGNLWCSKSLDINTVFEPIDNLSLIERLENARTTNVQDLRS